MKKFFLNDKVMLSIVLVNTFVIFLQECGLEGSLLSALDILCTLLFVIEMIIKHILFGVKNYWRDGWNVLDGVVTIISLPALLSYFVPDFSDYGFIIAFRALRVFKLFRTARRFPNLGEIWTGFRLAMSRSTAFLLGYFVIIVIFAMFNSALFGGIAPQYFANPLEGIYTVFQLFTVEGWYEIPNAIVGHLSPVWSHLVRLYFAFLLIGGGIIGMSLINSIFVDALAADNNDDVKEQLEQMEKKIDALQRLLEKQINS